MYAMQNAKIVNTHCYSSEVEKQFYYMNILRVLTVKGAASGDRVQHSFLSKRNVSKHLLHTLLSPIYL